jgi:hypothetical protein
MSGCMLCGLASFRAAAYAGTRAAGHRAWACMAPKEVTRLVACCVLRFASSCKLARICRHPSCRLVAAAAGLPPIACTVGSGLSWVGRTGVTFQCSHMPGRRQVRAVGGVGG